MLFDEFTNSTMQMHCAKQKKHAPSIIVDDAATKTNAVGVALPLAFVLVDHHHVDHDVVMSHKSTRSRRSKRRILNES